MADRVLPLVRLLIPCDKAERTPDGRWLITNPVTMAELPPGDTYPFQQEELFLYAQLGEGVGEFWLKAELYSVQKADLQEPIEKWELKKLGQSEPIRAEASPSKQLWGLPAVFRFSKITFEKPGIYVFRCFAGYAELHDARDARMASAYFRLL